MPTSQKTATTAQRCQRRHHFARHWALLLLLCACTARADLPLTVEDLITDPGRFKLDLSLTYANAEQHGVATGQPIVVQTGPTSFVSIPTQVGERTSNSDTLIGTLGLRYGLTDNTELYTRASGLYTHQRSRAAGRSRHFSEHRFADAWVGVNYQFKPDDETPALLGFTEVALREKHRRNSASFKSALLGFTTYKAIDPVVFSLTAAYRFNRNRRDGGANYRPGNMLLLNPSVGFAVNERVTLTTGMQWSSLQADKYNGNKQGQYHTRTDLLLGVAYGFSAQTTLNVNLKANVSGRDGADLRVSWLRQF